MEYMRYASQKRHAKISASYVLEKDYNIFIKKAKRKYRGDKEFLVVKYLDSFTSITSDEFDLYNYKEEDVIERWAFNGTRWEKF